jgi:hypothetical protein
VILTRHLHPSPAMHPLRPPVLSLGYGCAIPGNPGHRMPP